ncbi:anti-sigma factor [Oxalicibacterium flavum]|uniref:Anti-sigma factor n=2 Tax=Oxalicibacterium flavum TaxID=179467 RepID=A0A8J2XVQ2_9BURK|nr:anti-sigma factor [Oxalicibacterium flavum]
MTREQISALIDSELADGQVDIALAALRQEEARGAWDIYHQIGDALRSDELNLPLSADFNQRMFARLEAEPTILAPVNKKNAATPQTGSVRRFAVPGMAAAAVAAVAFLAVPNMLPQQAPTLASAPVAQPVVVASATPETVSVSSENGEVLRDPRIDDYLAAHQRFSPSVYSTAQYARSATFAVDSEK